MHFVYRVPLLVVKTLILTLALSLPALSLAEGVCEDLFRDVTQGMGPRGYLGVSVPYTQDNQVLAQKQGVFYWGTSIALVASEEVARRHDHPFVGLEKIQYLIAPELVGQLSKDMTGQELADLLLKALEVSDLVHFEDSYGEGGKKLGPEEATMHPVPREDVKNLIQPSALKYSIDDRGPRVGVEGWVFPKIRGVMTFDKTFLSKSSTVKKVLKLGRKLTEQGYSFRFNHDFQAALDKAKEQVRIEQGEVVESHYTDEDTYNVTLENYEKGLAVSGEVYDPEGNLVAGFLGSRSGNLFSGDTIFYDVEFDEDGQITNSNIDIAKAIIVAYLYRLHESGINMMDSQMTSKFSRSVKAFYMTGDEFAEAVIDLNSRPPADVDFETPFDFNKVDIQKASGNN